MPFAITTIRKPKKGAAASSAYSIYQSELDLLKGDGSLLDPFTKKIKSNNYFIKKRDIMMRALKNPSITPIKKNQIMVDLEILNRDQSVWGVTNQKSYKVSSDDLKAQLEDNWRSLWQDKETLRTGNVQAMAWGMLEGEDGINDIIGQLEEYSSTMDEMGGSEDAIAPLREKIKYLDKQASFWRGVISRPQEYAAVFDTESDGAIKDFQIKNIQDVKGFKDTGDAFGRTEDNPDGYSLFGKPHPNLTTEDGLEVIPIGNNVYKGGGESKMGFELQDKDAFDSSNLSNVPFEDYLPGTIVQSPSNNYRVSENDGTFTEYKDQQELEQAGYSPDGAVKVSLDDYSSIESMYDVIIPEEEKKKANIQEKLEQIRSQYEDQTKAWTQYKNLSPAEQGEIIGKTGSEILFSGGGEFWKSIPEVGKTFAEGGKEFVKAAPKVGLEALTAFPKSVKRAFVEKGKRVGETAKIFKGIFKGLRGDK